MHTTFALAALLPLASIGLAGPINYNNTEPTVTVHRRDTPDYCVPVSKVDQYETYAIDDQSSVCSAQGVADTCCITYIAGSICHNTLTSQDQTDLESALGQQITKDGQFKTTTVGSWELGFPDFCTAIANRGVETEWFQGISNFFNAYNKAESGQFVPTIQFQSSGGTIIAQYNC